MLSENSVSHVHVVNDWIYFVNNVADEYKICKMKTDRSDRTLVMDTSGSSTHYLNIVDDWIY